MEYPKLTHDEKRNTKLTLIEIEQIKKDYQRNPNLKLFADEYGVSERCIRYWVDDEWKIKQLTENKKRAKIRRMEESPEKKKFLLQQSYKAKKIRYWKFEKIRKWNSEKRQTPEHKKWAREYYQRDEVKIKLKNRESTPKYKLTRKKYRDQPENKIKAKEYQKNLRKNPDYQKKRKHYMKTYVDKIRNDPEKLTKYLEKKRERQKKYRERMRKEKNE